MSDHQHDDIWAHIGGLREDLGRAEARIAELEQAVSAHRENEPHLYRDGSSS